MRHFGRQRDVRWTAEDEPATVRALLRFCRCGEETFGWPAFGGSVFSARIKAKPGHVGGEGEPLFHGSEFLRAHFQSRLQWFRVCAQRGHEMQVEVEMMSGARLLQTLKRGR